MGPATPALFFASPEYQPRIECEPRESAFVVQVAVPLASATELQPVMLLLPSVNRTVPVGEEPPLTFTVKVMGWPCFAV